MPLDANKLRSRVRIEAGNPDIKEISEGTIDELIEDCLDKMGEMIPNWEIYNIKTVADKQDYDVDLNVIDVLFCDWSGTTTLSEVFGSDFDVLIDATRYDVEMGIYKRLKTALLKQAIADEYEWYFREVDKKLFLVPPPTSAGDSVYYVGLKRWSLALCPSRFERYVVWFATAEVLKARARKQRRLSAVSHTGGTHPWMLADPQLQDARTLEYKFNDAMRKEARKALF